MTRAQFQERERIWSRDAFEAEATAGLDGDPPAVEVPTNLSAKRQQYACFAAWLQSEQAKLNALESKKAELGGLISAPAEAESNLRALVRRSADRLLHGLGADESDAAKRVELETKHAAQRHQADAARVALPQVEQQIEVARLRVDKLMEREKEFLFPCVREASESVERLLARKEAEIAELKRLLAPLYANYRGYGGPDIEAPRVEVKWRHSWHDVADKFKSYPAADITRMLPNIKF
jgi:hypothetical protein